MTTAIQKYLVQKNVEHTIAKHFPKIIWFIYFSSSISRSGRHSSNVWAWLNIIPVRMLYITTANKKQGLEHDWSLSSFQVTTN